MRTLTWTFFCVILSLGFAGAQETPKVEIFGGYTYANADFTGAGLKNTSFNGWDAAFTGNLNRWLGVVADFGGHYGSSNISVPVPVGTCPPVCLPAISVDSTAHEFLSGPRVSYRTEKITPFAHILLGAEHVTASAAVALPAPAPSINISASQTGFAVAFGGGLDLNLTKRIAWRNQADYLQTRLFHGTQNNVRFSTGIALRF
jgi:opacity protein-like surface antigen